MSRTDLLIKMGLFVRPDFLSVEACARVSVAMRAAPSASATVYVGPAVTGVDESQRRTLSADLPVEVAAPIEEALDRLRPSLEQHFNVTLREREPSHYLVYGPGAFFRPHRDRRDRRAGTTQAVEAADRQVSVVLLLNRPDAADGGYAGGDLRFFRLIDAPGWREVGVACEADAGLLIAFRADTIHEVTEVTAGHRCSIVTWFL